MIWDESCTTDALAYRYLYDRLYRWFEARQLVFFLNIWFLFDFLLSIAIGGTLVHHKSGCG